MLLSSRHCFTNVTFGGMFEAVETLNTKQALNDYNQSLL